MLRPTIYLPSRRHRLLDQRLMARPAPAIRPVPARPTPAPVTPSPEAEPVLMDAGS